MFKKISLILLLISSQSFASQIKSVSNNGTVYAMASQKGFTRISVKGDRILNITGASGVYTLQDDPNQGVVFLKLISDPKQFTVFVTTEQGRNYVLRLTPKKIASDNLILRPLDAVSVKAKHWEQASPYTETITKLIKDMVNHKNPEGYAVDAVKSKVQHLGNVATIRLISVYRGDHLQGKIYRVTNISGQALTLDERQFYQAGDRAIAIMVPLLPVNGCTLMYKVSV